MTRRPYCLVLLAMILLAEPNRRLSRKALAIELWPDDDEDTAIANLRRHLSTLMQALPEAGQPIGRDRETVWCREDAVPWCDVVEFERGALDLYRADFMEGSTHEWVLAQRERLREIAVARWLQRAHDERESDAYDDAIASARRATRIDPCSESAARLEIELHGERGNLAALDAAFAAYERRLRDLDATPDPETLALVARFHALARDAAARIPRPVSSFVETHQLAEIVSSIRTHRLVTLAGPGGVGKTRLALEAAHRVAASFPDGAYFIDLSRVLEGDALADAIARALGAPPQLAAKGFPGISSLLQNRRALLILDNCEQIVESCAWFVSTLLEAAHHVHIVATTREAFGMHAEHCHIVRPLAIPDAKRLFVERARGAAWNGDDRIEADMRIAGVCERLDGLPLAVELAASMLGSLSLSDVEHHLDEGLDILKSRDPTASARHRSLDDVVAWSVSLLDEADRDAFTRLGAFSGSFSARAAREVCGVDVATLASLVSKSMVLRPDDLESRFVLLSSIGHFARRRLERHPHNVSLRNAHAAWFADIAMHSDERTFWPSERQWLDDVARNFPNFAQAYNWSLFGAGCLQSGIRLTIGLTPYFLRRGFYMEGAAWVRAAIDRAALGSVDRGRLTYCLSSIMSRQGHLEEALVLASAATTILAVSGLERDLARAMNLEAMSLLHLDRLTEAERILERALPIARQSGDADLEGRILMIVSTVSLASDPQRAYDLYLAALKCFNEAGDWGQAAYALNCMAAIDYSSGRYDEASEALERALAMFQGLGDASLAAGVRSDMGDVETMRGNIARAHVHYAAAFAFIETRDYTSTDRYLLSGISALAEHAGRPRDAARLLGAALQRASKTNTAAIVRVAEHVRARVEQQIGHDAFERESAVGFALPRAEAMRVARSVLERATTMVPKP